MFDKTEIAYFFKIAELGFFLKGLAKYSHKDADFD